MNLLQHLRTWFAKNRAWLRWVLAVGVLAILFHRHWSNVQELKWSEVHFGLLFLALVFCLASQIVTYVRWYLLVWAQDIPFSVRDALRFGFIGYLFNYVAPGAVGGDLIKASMIAREQTERRLIAVSTVFLDRVVGMMGLLIVGALAMFSQTSVTEHRDFQYFMAAFQIGSLVSILGFTVLLLPGISRMKWLNRIAEVPKIGHSLAELINSFRLYQTRWRVLVLSLAMSLVSHVGLIFSVYLCSASLRGVDGIPSWTIHLQIVPPAELAGVLAFFLPGGMGALEEAIAQFYVMANPAFDQGFMAAFVFRIVTILIALLGGIWYLTSRREIEEAIHENLSPDEMDDTQNALPTIPVKAVSNSVSEPTD